MDLSGLDLSSGRRCQLCAGAGRFCRAVRHQSGLQGGRHRSGPVDRHCERVERGPEPGGGLPDAFRSDGEPAPGGGGRVRSGGEHGGGGGLPGHGAGGVGGHRGQGGTVHIGRDGVDRRAGAGRAARRGRRFGRGGEHQLWGVRGVPGAERQRVLERAVAAGGRAGADGVCVGRGRRLGRVRRFRGATDGLRRVAGERNRLDALRCRGGRNGLLL